MKKRIISILMALVFVFTCTSGFKKASAATRITITKNGQVVSMPACGGTMELVVTHPCDYTQRDFTVFTNESKKTASGMATSKIISTSANSSNKLTRVISVTCQPNYTGKKITYCILCSDVYISFYQNPMSTNIGNLKIDNVLTSSKYQAQCSFRPINGAANGDNDIGLCDYCAGTNLLNRKLAQDGLYNSTRYFDIKDLLVASQNAWNTFGHKITKNDIITVGKRWGNGLVFSFKSAPVWGPAGFLKESYSISTIDNSKTYKIKTIETDSNTSPLSSKDRDTIKNYLCQLLKEHPEGILVRGYYGFKPASGIGHTLVITYCDNNGQLYAIDTGKSQNFGTKTVKLEDTWLYTYAKTKNSSYNFFDWIHSVSFIQ